MVQEKWQEAIYEYSKVLPNNDKEITKKIQFAQLQLKISLRKNLYAIMGVQKGANQNELKKAYKLGALKWHPDKHVNGTAEERKNAEETFKDIGEAYGVLSDPFKRQLYDGGADLEEIDLEIKMQAQGRSSGTGPHSSNFM